MKIRNVMVSAFILSGAILLSCKKSGNSVATQSIVGAWTADSANTKEYMAGVLKSNETAKNIGQVTFKENGSFTTSDPNAYGEYKFTGSTISVKYSNEANFNTANVLQYTAKKLVAQGTANHNPPQNGVDKVVVTVYFSR